MSETELIGRVSALAERCRRLAYPTHPPIFIEVAEELELFVAALQQALAERDEARGTSRKLNREKQQLESDIAHNRDIIAEFHAGSDMDRAYLSLHRERADLRADLARLTAALSAETEWHDILTQLNVTDDELIRIKNGIKGDGSVKIWSKMLYIILDNVLTLRRHAAAIRQRQGERS